MSAEHHSFMVRIQTAGEVSKNEGDRIVAKTRKENEHDENTHHGDVNVWEFGSLENGNKKNAKLTDTGKNNAGNCKSRLVLGNVWLESAGLSQVETHDDGTEEENHLETNARNEQRLQIRGCNIRKINRILIFRHEVVDRVTLDSPTYQKSNQHTPPHHGTHNRYEVVVKLCESRNMRRHYGNLRGKYQEPSIRLRDFARAGIFGL